jgi:hypothetical protein
MYIDIKVSKHHLLEKLSFLQYVFIAPLPKVSVMHGFISWISILSHLVYLLLYQYNAVLVTMTLQYVLKSGVIMPLALFFLLKTVSSYATNGCKTHSDIHCFIPEE